MIREEGDLLPSSNYCPYKLAIIHRLIAASDRSRIYINSNNSDVINVTFQIRSNYYRTKKTRIRISS